LRNRDLHWAIQGCGFMNKAASIQPMLFPAVRLGQGTYNGARIRQRRDCATVL
jgi:hypothetical protein